MKKGSPCPGEDVQVSAASDDILTGQVLEIFRTVLEQPEMGKDNDYFLCGGNSLNAMEVLARLEDLTGRLLRISDLYACRSAERLSRFIGGEQETGREERHKEKLRPAPELERYPLTPIQQGIYVQSCMDPEGFTYHMPGAFRIRGEVEPEKLEEAFRKVIAGDRIFRTAFVQEDDGIFARIRGEVPFSLPVLQGNSLAEVMEQIRRPFCLGEAPLLRAGLWQNGEEDWFLLIDVHHIIADGMSTPILAKRLSRYYEGGSPGI